MTHSREEIASVAMQPSGLEWRTITMIFVLTWLFFSFFTFRVIPPGDPAQNLYHVLTQDLGPRPTFISYTIMGILFTSVFAALGLPVDVGLNCMSAVFGALGAACGYVIALTLVRDRRIALTAVIIMVLSGVYWYQAEIGDVYMTSYALGLLAMAGFLRGRYLFAGGSYAVALLAYPVAALVVPFFLWVAYRERIGMRNFLRFVFAGAAIYLPVILITFQEYFFGRMGIMPTLFVEPVATEGRLELDLLRTVNHFGYIYALSFNVMLLLVAYGFIDTFFRHRAVWSVAMSAALGPMLFGFLNQGTDLADPYFFASIFFLSILASLSLWHLFSRLFASRTLQALAIAGGVLIYGGLSYAWVVEPLRHDVVALKQAFLKLERELPADAVLLSSWGISLTYNLYTRPFIYDQPYPEVMRTGRCHNIERTMAQQIEAWLAERSQLYLLDGIFWQSPLKDTVKQLLPQRTYQRLSGTGSLTEAVLSLDKQVRFVKMNTFPSGLLVLYQVLPPPGGRRDALPKTKQGRIGDSDA
jgi:hypothetical protein